MLLAITVSVVVVAVVLVVAAIGYLLNRLNHS
jgi:F0F1-type ATP synthase assembly protein I